MLHVKEIENLYEEGRSEEAREAIDLLLSLGPNNTEALKLKALILGQQGRFAEEADAWEAVIDVDGEDEDAITFFRMRNIESREQFYFTDELPEGGRRFLAYPRSLIRHTLLALVGCVLFLVLSRLTDVLPALQLPLVILPLFGLLVIIPWAFTMYSWASTIRSVSLTREGIEFSTRIKTHRFLWSNLDGIYLAHGVDRHGEGSLSLVVLPKNKEESSIDLDLSPESSSIRARTYLVKDIGSLFRDPEPTPRSELDLEDRELRTF